MGDQPPAEATSFSKMSLISKFVLRICGPAWIPDTSDSIPSDRANFERCLPKQLKTLARYLKRRIFLSMVGQSKLEANTIADPARTILWINQTAPSLGDALMDTAARTLLLGRRVVFITNSKNVDLFREDPVFEAAFTAAEFERSSYAGMKFDLVIVDSYSPRSINLKRRFAKDSFFVGLYGYLNAYEVHRTEYSFRRMETLLGLKGGSTSTSLAIGLPGSSAIAGSPEIGKCDTMVVAIGIGGEWPFRTYDGWGAVVAEILAKFDATVLLVGSGNGTAQAERIIQDCGSQRVHNLVGKTPLREVPDLLRRADLYVGSDGGLWHVASACGIPSVALHADCQLYDPAGNWRSRAATNPHCIPLRANYSVNEIPAEAVIAAVGQTLTKLRS